MEIQPLAIAPTPAGEDPQDGLMKNHHESFAIGGGATAPPDDCPVEDLKRRSTNFVLDSEDEQDGVRNHQFHDWLEEDRRHGINCKTLPLTLFTWLVFLIVAWSHGNIDNTFRMRECLKGAIEEVKARHSVSGIGKDVKAVVSLNTVTSVDEMWSWIEGGLVPAMAGHHTKPGFVRTFNKVIGSIQLREERFLPGGCQVGKDLSDYYRQGCHVAGDISSLSYGPNKEAATTGDISQMDPAFTAGYGIDELSASNSQRFFSWLNVQNSTIGQERANYLRTLKWIDDGTKELEVTVAFFNSEIQTYGIVKMKLKLERGGLIKADMEVRSLWATMYTKWYMILVDVVWGLCVLKFIVNSVQKAVDNKTAKSCIKRWCKLHKSAGGGWWLALDWLGAGMGLVIMSFLLIFSSGFNKLGADLGSMGDTPIPMMYGNETAYLANLFDRDLGSYYAKNAAVIEEIEYLIEVKNIHRMLMFWYAMIFLARWFKGFRGQARMAQITSTLADASADMSHFAIIFAVLFVNFALAGHCLFGSEVPEWSTLNQSLQSSLAMAWGRIDYGPMHEIAPISAMLWLFGYVLTMCMISMNMLLAIISDHYGDCFHANNAGERGYDLISQIIAMLYEIYWNTTYMMRYVWRIVYRALPTRPKNWNIKGYYLLPDLPHEEWREEVPYERIYQMTSADPLGYSSSYMLRRCGCDRATAEHLMRKCEDEVLRHVDEFYPLEQLFDEFDESMQQYYFAMDSFSNELRTWFGSTSIGAAKMIPRQSKLDTIAGSLEEAQHIEHKHHHHHSAETMEGQGVHHHHHRTKKEEDDDEGEADGGNKSGSNSQLPSHVPSQSASRAESRSPSKHTTTTTRSRY